MVSNRGILMAAAAAAWSSASISAGYSPGLSTVVVSTSEVRFGHSQEGSMAKK